MRHTASAQIVCAACAAINSADEDSCAECGSPLIGGSGPVPSGCEPPISARLMCPGCERINDPSAHFCYYCGVRIPPDSTAPLNAVGDPAGLGIRLVSGFIDLLVSGVALYLYGALRGAHGGQTAASDPLLGTQSALAVFVVIVCVIDLVLSAVTIALTGRTIGKWITGLRVIQIDGEKPALGLMLIRLFAYGVSLLPFGLGVLWIPLSSHERAWHDYLCGTRVIRVMR